MSIAVNLKKIHIDIPPKVTLVCVSKFHSNDAILEAYREGERVFGESKVQELCGKSESLPKDIHWHFIGHLQTNKVKYIVPFVELIHSVDSLKLLTEINRQAMKVGRVVSCLLQLHIAQEETKFGFSSEELIDLLKKKEFDKFLNIRICGIMGMATLTSNSLQIRTEFASLKIIFDSLKTNYFKLDSNFNILSMGMSDDFQLAIEEGSTMIRVGSRIFGNRVYS